VVAIIVGFALLLTPLVVSAYDIGDPDSYRYEASEVEFYANGTYSYSTAALPLDSDVACFGDLPTRSCVLERAIHANGGIAYDGPPRRFMEHEYSYVHIWGDGFFRPSTEGGPNETVIYGLEPLPRAEALDRIATLLSRANDGVRTAIETGTYETSDELAGVHELVRADDGYYVVYPTAIREQESERTLTVVGLQWMLWIIGAVLILRGQRHRVEHR
jgi:hypothetical protein